MFPKKSVSLLRRCWVQFCIFLISFFKEKKIIFFDTPCGPALKIPVEFDPNLPSRISADDFLPRRRGVRVRRLCRASAENKIDDLVAGGTESRTRHDSLLRPVYFQVHGGWVQQDKIRALAAEGHNDALRRPRRVRTSVRFKAHVKSKLRPSERQNERMVMLDPHAFMDLWNDSTDCTPGPPDSTYECETTVWLAGA